MAPPATNVPKKKKNTRKGFPHPKKIKRSDPAYSTLRKSLKPGTIVILLAGRFRGKHAVVLRQLPHNGPLVITGPFVLNGIPLRRVDPAYVIATATSIDLGTLDTTLPPTLFKRESGAKRIKGEGDFMGDAKKKAAEKTAKKTSKAARGTKPTVAKKPLPEERVALQKKLDDGVMSMLKKDAIGSEKAGYLRSVFTIKPGDCPHRMKW